MLLNKISNLTKVSFLLRLRYVGSTYKLKKKTQHSSTVFLLNKSLFYV
jgi:hypothetical protein